MSKQLRVTAVTVKEVLGAREFAIEPGRITILSGKNGSGKSTALAAVQAALGGGNLAKLAHIEGGKKGEPEVVLVINGPGFEEYRIEKGQKLKVKQRVDDTAAFADLDQPPQGWLSSLYDPDGANPVAFLMAKDDVRATMLLEALPLKYDRAALLAQAGVNPATLPPLPAGLHPLEDIALIRHAVFTQRTGVNRDQKGKESAADQTRRAAPAVVPADPSAQIKTLETSTRELEVAIARREEEAKAAEGTAVQEAKRTLDVHSEEITGRFKTTAAKLRAAHDQKAAEIRAEAERQIATLKDKLDAEINRERLDGDGAIDALEEAFEKARDAARMAREASMEETNASRQDLQANLARLATLRAQADTAKQAAALHAQAKAFDDEADSLEAESERLTQSLNAIDAFRRQLAQDLPIPGLEVEGKAISVNGVPYEQLNTAQRVDIAVQVACLRAKGSRLPVVFVDGAEALDDENFGLLVERLLVAGVQAFIGRVTNEPLTVETVDEAHEVAPA